MRDHLEPTKPIVYSLTTENGVLVCFYCCCIQRKFSENHGNIALNSLIRTAIAIMALNIIILYMTLVIVLIIFLSIRRESRAKARNANN